MTGEELQAMVKRTEATGTAAAANIFEFPTGRRLGSEEIDVLLEMEAWEQVLSEW